MAAHSYDDIADWYDEFVQADSLLDDPYFPAVQALMGSITSLRLCDLACGQGRVARHLAHQGAHVVGIDRASKLLAIARRYERSKPCGVAYLQDDAQALNAVQDAVFDGVICHMALMDIPDLSTTIQSVYRILRPGGWFVFSILHPCYHTSTSREIMAVNSTISRIVSAYFEEGLWRQEDRPGPPGKVGAYHRTLSTYINTLTSAGLIVERLDEPRATPSLAARRPIWWEVPAVLIARCWKGA